MRWLLSLLPLVLAAPAFGEYAVYTGAQSVKGEFNSSTRLAAVIDLETGHIVSVALTGGRTNFSYVVGPEVPYLEVKSTDAAGHAVTAFAQAASGSETDGSAVAASSNLRGRDAKVTLATAGPSQWPKSLAGGGAVVASAGAGGDATVTFSTTTLALSEPFSKVANGFGSLSTAASAIGPLFRNQVAKTLHYPAAAAPHSTSGSVTVPDRDPATFGSSTSATLSSSGVTTTGAGILLLNGASTYTGGTLLNGGTLQVGSGSLSSAITLTRPIVTYPTYQPTPTPSVPDGAELFLGGNYSYPSTHYSTFPAGTIINATVPGSVTLIPSGNTPVTTTNSGTIFLGGIINGAVNYNPITVLGSGSLNLTGSGTLKLSGGNLGHVMSPSTVVITH